MKFENLNLVSRAILQAVLLAYLEFSDSEGRLPKDKELASILRVHEATICKARKVLGLSPFQPHDTAMREEKSELVKPIDELFNNPSDISDPKNWS